MVDADDERDVVDGLEKVEADELAEKDLSSLGHADSAGVGEMEGEGEESLVNGGDAEALLSVVAEGLGIMLNS